MPNTEAARSLVAELRWVDRESRGALADPALMRRLEARAESLMTRLGIFGKCAGARAVA